jgi:competence protein ComEC
MIEREERLAFFILAILIFANLSLWLVVAEFLRPKFLEVIFFDVGQGEAVFLKIPPSYQILIDGGPSSVILEKLAKEMPFWDRSLDLVILTSPKSERISGLLEVLKKYRVESVIYPTRERETAEFKEWQNLLEKEKAKIIAPQNKEKISSPRFGKKDWFLEIFYPWPDFTKEKPIVLKLVYGKTSFLFTSEIEKSEEKDLMADNFDLKADVLKVARYGSKKSNSEEFIKAVSPQIAVVSVGKNRWDYPDKEVLENLGKQGIKILRTDRDGDIKVISDGNSLKIKTKNEISDF